MNFCGSADVKKCFINMYFMWNDLNTGFIEVKIIIQYDWLNLTT